MERLPKSGATVCLKPGETLTDDERDALDGYFLAMRAALVTVPGRRTPMADLAHAAENDTDLFGDRDARHWAERFAAKWTVARSGTGEPVEAEDLMLTWFAGAIESGFDLGRRHMPGQELSEGEPILTECDSLEQAVYVALGAVSVCWEDLSQAGVFDSVRAKQIGRELMDLIKRQPEWQPLPGRVSPSSVRAREVPVTYGGPGGPRIGTATVQETSEGIETITRFDPPPATDS
jgi:hypothetical protein